MREFIEAFLIVLAVLVAVIVGVNLWDRYKCDQYSHTTERKTKHISFDGCYIKNK